LPMLHVGLECGISNNPQLAMKFLHDAEQLAPKDPYVCHEMGVVKFNEKKYGEAFNLFSEALQFLKSPTSRVFLETWEPLFNNLGHASRKMKRYDEAYHFHRRALVLCPSNASTHSAIGLLHAITGKTELAIESFHKALSLRKEDTFSNTMLRHVIEKMVEESNGEPNTKGSSSSASADELDGSEYPVLFKSKLFSKQHEYLSTAPMVPREEDLLTLFPHTTGGGGASAYVEWLQHSQELLDKYKGRPGVTGTRVPHNTTSTEDSTKDDIVMEFDDSSSSEGDKSINPTGHETGHL